MSIDYVVTAWLYERYMAERELWPEEVANLERLVNSLELVYKIYPPAMQPNSFPIRIYRVTN